MSRKTLAGLMTKYLRGETTAEEERQLFNWYESLSVEEEPLDDFSLKQKQILKQKMFAQINENIHTSEITIKRKRIAKIIGYSGLMAAAILIFFIRSSFVNTQPIDRPIASQEVLIKNHTHEILKQRLPDNSVVWLKPAAELSFKKKFDTDIRRVSLKGDAFFEVVHHNKWPFIVSSGNIITHVLGTSFNIKAAGTTGVAEVSVISGKVMVYVPEKNARVLKKQVLLLPDEKAVYKVHENTLSKNIEYDADVEMWKKSTLSFDNEPLKDVIKQLNKRFNSHITVADKEIEGYKLNANFKNINLAVIMELLQTSLNVTYQINNEEIILRRKNTNYELK